MIRRIRSPIVLSIAGSDSGGLSGIQADIQTFAAYGVHGLTAITALTAQNSTAVTAARAVPPAFLRLQLDVLHADFDISAVKIGMLSNAAAVRVVAEWLRDRRLRNVVLDPVLFASSGRKLLSDAGLRAMREQLLPLATIVTPNVPEIEAMLSRRITDEADLRAAAAALRRSGVKAVLLKGGHFAAVDSAVHDVYVDARGIMTFEHLRQPYSVRGTGCALASAIAAGLAQRRPLRDAVTQAEDYLQRGYLLARPIGRGAAHALWHAG